MYLPRKYHVLNSSDCFVSSYKRWFIKRNWSRYVIRSHSYDKVPAAMLVESLKLNNCIIGILSLFLFSKRRFNDIAFEGAVGRYCIINPTEYTVCIWVSMQNDNELFCSNNSPAPEISGICFVVHCYNTVLSSFDLWKGRGCVWQKP